MRAIVIAAMMIATALPVHAASLDLREMARIYCDAVVAGNTEALIEVLSEELGGLVGDKGDVPLFWAGRQDPAETCMPVGNRGTRDRPETIIVFGALGKQNWSATIVMELVDGNKLRVDDVTFDDGTTLRDRLAVRA